MTDTWTLERRRQLLASYSGAMERLDTLLWAEGAGGEADRAEIDRLQAQLSELWDAYVAAVPRLPVARCPFSGAVVHHSCDDAGLDGLWWQYESPARPEESLPPTLWTLTGAVSIAAPPEACSFLCKPGPGVPYVFPQLLSAPPVKAVVRALPVGRHTAYAVTYFVELPGLRLPRPNTWGTDHYSWIEAGRRRWGQADEEEALDFDLDAWLERGKLLWIAPGDAGLTLQSGRAGCPYVGLSGEQRPQYVQYGKVTTW